MLKNRLSHELLPMMRVRQKNSRKNLVDRFTQTIKIANTTMLQSKDKTKSCYQRVMEQAEQRAKHSIPIKKSTMRKLNKRMSLFSVEKGSKQAAADETLSTLQTLNADKQQLSHSMYHASGQQQQQNKFNSSFNQDDTFEDALSLKEAVFSSRRLSDKSNPNTGSLAEKMLHLTKTLPGRYSIKKHKGEIKTQLLTEANAKLVTLQARLAHIESKRIKDVN